MYHGFAVLNKKFVKKLSNTNLPTLLLRPEPLGLPFQITDQGQ